MNFSQSPLPGSSLISKSSGSLQDDNVICESMPGETSTIATKVINDLQIPEASPPSKFDSQIQPLFTWVQLKTIIANGHLHLLARHPADLKEYFSWRDIVAAKYGDVQSYVIRDRLGWSENGKISFPPGESPGEILTMDIHSALNLRQESLSLSWFKAHGDPSDRQVLENDWPYSIPKDVTHFVVWSKLPILHPLLIPPHLPYQIRYKAWKSISSKGLFGLLGGNLASISNKASIKRKDAVSQGMLLTPPSSRSEDNTESVENDALSDLDIQTNAAQNIDSHVQYVLDQARFEIETFVLNQWPDDEYELLYFANPPVLQSVPQLPHFHVLAKKKN